MITIVALSITVNLIIFVWKFKSGRVLDGLIDCSLMIIVFMLFQGSFNALSVGTLGSALFSLFTLAFPIIKPNTVNNKKKPLINESKPLSYDEIWAKIHK